MFDLLLGLGDSVVEVTSHNWGCTAGFRAGRPEKGLQSVEMEADEQETDSARLMEDARTLAVSNTVIVNSLRLMVFSSTCRKWTNGRSMFAGGRVK